MLRVPASRHPLKNGATAFAVLIALAILISLGIWQLQRKAWKEALIADIDGRAHAAATALPPGHDWRDWHAASDEFRHVSASGTFLHDREIAVYGLMPAAQAGITGRTGSVQGHYLFTPLRLSDGAAVFVNRGFVPDGALAQAERPAGTVQVEGIVRAPEQRGWFVPENRPERGEWFTRDNVAMATALGLADAAPFYIEADAAGAGAPPWPRGGVTKTIVLKNDHLQYALTWFGLALVLVLVSGYAALRNARQRA